MFAKTSLNIDNQKSEKRFRLLFGAMTLMLIVPVAILSLLINHGSAALSIDFFLTDPTNGMTEEAGSSLRWSGLFGLSSSHSSHRFRLAVLHTLFE